jgi:hypothetical protein
VSYFAPARIATNGCLGFPSHESDPLFLPSTNLSHSHS